MASAGRDSETCSTAYTTGCLPACLASPDLPRRRRVPCRWKCLVSSRASSSGGAAGAACDGAGAVSVIEASPGVRRRTGGRGCGGGGRRLRGGRRGVGRCGGGPLVLAEFWGGGGAWVLQPAGGEPAALTRQADQGRRLRTAPVHRVAAAGMEYAPLRQRPQVRRGTRDA